MKLKDSKTYDNLMKAYLRESGAYNEYYFYAELDGNIDCVADSSEQCIEKLAAKMGSASYITVFYGEEVSDEQAQKALEIIEAAKTGAEIVSIKGGQPIYSYIISVER